MSYKLFSTRLDEDLIQEIKELGSKKQQSLQSFLTEIIRDALVKEKEKMKEDPWAKFVGVDSAIDPEILTEKRKRSMKGRKARRSKLDVL
jgi:hypothetical protein